MGDLVVFNEVRDYVGNALAYSARAAGAISSLARVVNQARAMYGEIEFGSQQLTQAARALDDATGGVLTTGIQGVRTNLQLVLDLEASNRRAGVDQAFRDQAIIDSFKKRKG